MRKLFAKKDRILLLGAIVLGGMNAVLSSFISLVLQKIVDAATGGSMAEFSRLFVFILIYLAVLGIMGFAEAYCGKRMIRNITNHLRDDLFQGILKRTPARFHAHNSADYLSALINDVKLLEENYLIPLLLSSQMIVMFFTTLGILFYLSPVVTLVLLLFLILMFLIPGLLGKKMQKRQDACSEKLAEFTACSKDYLNGYDVIRSYNIFAHIFRKYRKINWDAADKKFAADTLLAVNECLSDLLSALSIIVIIFLSSFLLLKGHITMGTLLALVQLSSAFVTPVVMLMQNVPKLTSMKPIIDHLITLKEDLTENKTESNFSVPPSLHHAINCNQISFGYEDGSLILDDLNLKLKAHGKYALLGDSGCGKSTLIRLLTGYTSDFAGEITYDHRSVRDLSIQELSRMTAVIHQNVFLFDTDIYENICLGQTFSEEDLAYALSTSGVAKFLPSLSQGLHTPVGENGQYLSGGQRQRILIARALIRRTPVLIIDEGTSAVDQQTSLEIEKSLLLEEALTIIVVTHHMNEQLVPFYDHIFHIKSGQVLS